jgi:threonylcarbamoyladenosine tRNA methylthiotransferase MtaB
MSQTYRFRTLGCRVNHAETRELESVLLQRGLVAADANAVADLEIIHTCSVTGQAAAKSRHAIRRSIRQHRSHDGTGHGPHVIVTGCFVGTDPRQANDLAGEHGTTIAHAAPDQSTLTQRFTAYIDHWLNRPARCVANISDRTQRIVPLPVVLPQTPARHTRAEVRIQDGCDAYCTFCIIPKIRPQLRSKTIEDTVAEVTRLVDLGHTEVVLSGIFLGAFGHETALRRKQVNHQADPLADVLDAVARIPGLHRLRLSSLEPGDVTPPLLDAMLAHSDTVVPHLHLPLQSGSDAVLRRMNRQYTAGDYLDMIDMVIEALTDCTAGLPDLPPAITTDIICGFPGETEDQFRQTVEIARRVGYLHMHVFPYSDRSGTAAARWRSNAIPMAIRKARVRQLIDLENDPASGLSIRYRQRLLGRTVRVIAEHPDQQDPALTVGRCDHYSPVHIPGTFERGTVLKAKITAVTPHRVMSEYLHAHDGVVALPVLPGSSIQA